MKKITFAEKLGFGLNNLGAGIWMSFINTFLLYFYTNVAHIRPAVASLIISLAVIWDAINDPLFASLADNHRFKNGEKMRPLLWSSVPLALCLILTFTVFGEENSTLCIVLAFLSYFVFRIPSTVHMLSVNGLKQLVSPDDKDRVSVGTWASGGGAFGMALASIIFWPIIRGVAKLDAAGNMINPRLGFTVGAAIAGAIVIAAAAFNYFTSAERVHDDASSKVPFLKSCKIMLSRRDFNINLGMLFLYGLYSTIVSGYSLYYCTYVIGKPGLVSAVMATYVVGIVVSLPFVNSLYKKLGRKSVILIGTLILVAGGTIFVLFPRQIFSPFVLTSSIGVGTNLITVMLGLNRADITDEIGTQEGIRFDGMVNNVMYFVQKLGNALLTFILGLILEYSHFDGNLASQPKSAVTAIYLIMGLTTIIASVGIASLSFGLNMDDKKA